MSIIENSLSTVTHKLHERYTLFLLTVNKKIYIILKKIYNLITLFYDFSIFFVYVMKIVQEIILIKNKSRQLFFM